MKAKSRNLISVICFILCMIMCLMGFTSAYSADYPSADYPDGYYGEDTIFWPYIRERRISIRIGEHGKVNVLGYTYGYGLHKKKNMDDMIAAGELEFISYDSDIVEVSETGIITPNRKGETTITIYLKLTGLHCEPWSVDVTVLGEKKTLAFVNNRILVKPGSKKMLKTKTTGINSVRFKLKSKKMHRIIKLVKKKPDSVVLKAKRKGKAVVIDKARGKTARCKIIVK